MYPMGLIWTDFRTRAFKAKGDRVVARERWQCCEGNGRLCYSLTMSGHITSRLSTILGGYATCTSRRLGNTSGQDDKLKALPTVTCDGSAYGIH